MEKELYHLAGATANLGCALGTLRRAYAGSDRHHKIISRRSAHILHAVLFTRTYKANRPRHQRVHFAIHGQLQRPFAHEKHFRMHMMVRWMRHSAGWQHGRIDRKSVV